MVNNKDLIKSVFNDDVVKYNDWFFKANWKSAKIASLETKSSWLKIKSIIWNNGTWKNGSWEGGTWINGTWEDGIWYNGTWKNGTWKHGFWFNGIWKDGKWVKGRIYDSKKKKYRESTVPPNECKWSSSYGK